MNQTMSKLKEQLFLQQYLKKAEKESRETYARFLRMKLNGEDLSTNHLTRDLLVALYVEDGLIDKQIAFIFGVTRNEIQEIREEWEIYRALAS